MKTLGVFQGNVLVHVALLREPVPADEADVRLLARVRPDVVHDAVGVGVHVAADAAKLDHDF